MVKKVVLIGGGVALVSLLLFGHSAISYVRTSANYVSGAVHESVPIEFQIDRARDMLKDLVPEIRKNMHVIAKEEVEVKKLEEQIEQSKARLEKEKEQVMRLKSDLSSGNETFRYAGRNYTPDQVKSDLTARFERYKTNDATLASLEQILQARQKSLDAARQRLEGMMVAKRQLQVDVENLEARTQMVAAAQTTSQYQFDDSQLGRVKELIANLKTRLEVAERLANAEVSFPGEIPLETSTPESIVDEVTEYFEVKPAEAVGSLAAIELE
jgi:chromosome segregation ATPase